MKFLLLFLGARGTNVVYLRLTLQHGMSVSAWQELRSFVRLLSDRGCVTPGAESIMVAYETTKQRQE
jgi:hypothetical protein